MYIVGCKLLVVGCWLVVVGCGLKKLANVSLIFKKTTEGIAKSMAKNK